MDKPVYGMLKTPFIVKRGNSFELHVYRDSYNKPSFKLVALQALGHLFLTMEYCINTEVWETFQDGYVYNPDKDTLDDNFHNNWFALSFLMPKDEFVKQVKKHKVNNKVSLSVIAEYFKVSLNDVDARGIMLGLWRSEF